MADNDAMVEALQIDLAKAQREAAQYKAAHLKCRDAVDMLEVALRWYAADDCAKQALYRLEQLRGRNKRD